MASLKPLKGVAYDIAHHAQSGLSFLHPHLGEMCREVGITEATIDLMANESYPAELREYKPLKLAIGALKDKFAIILSKREMSLDFISELKLKFIFYTADNSLCAVESTLVKTNGITHIQTVK
ncbi:hypothetical protein PA25_14440 [Pseudoalteromonas sp. A25]|uniref:hypothetical protein n=1 Tax=Pseudoalteromonas sp. A25 TaxID=116092 RepID=UPI001260AEAD|nr:hypothetical protein [Pseudoalteromonas sp. A25]BBN81459.1 hypothetical protein PA25_14440 [Pseudoalteromonas sp. A25]